MKWYKMVDMDSSMHILFSSTFLLFEMYQIINSLGALEMIKNY